MRKVVYKGFFVWNFEKEEKWLNEMATKGLALISVGPFRYEFEDSLPDEYEVRLELLKKSVDNPESESYIRFVEGTGAEYIGTFKRWVYFRKKTKEGSFELYSDNSSKIKQIERIIGSILFIVLLNIFFGAENIYFMLSLDSAFNAMGFINLFLGVFGLIGIIRLWKKKKKLERDKDIYM